MGTLPTSRVSPSGSAPLANFFMPKRTATRTTAPRAPMAAPLRFFSLPTICRTAYRAARAATKNTIHA
jgi:hypothetical protein